MPDMLLTALRNSLRQIRKQLKPTYRLRASKQICQTISQLEAFRQAKHIALYHAIQGEVDLGPIWQSAPLQGKFCYFPCLQGKQLIFLPATPNTPFKKNRYDILEPDVDRALARLPSQLDLIILPLVAFDAQCNRLGMGSGYYDRSLAGCENCFLLGVGYPFQKVPFLEAREWDVSLDAVVTVGEIYWPPKDGRYNRQP